MKRRDFISLLGGAAASTWPRAAYAQPGKLPTIGFLGQSTASAEIQRTTPFEQRLRELGWIEGRTVTIAYRWAEGRSERFAELAAEFVRLKVDVIVTQGSAMVATKQATSLIPIVFAGANDPVGTGLVASLARPGGNATGLSLQQFDLAGKRLEILRELVPHLRRLAVMINVGNASAGAALEVREIRTAAAKLGDVTILEFRRGEDIEPAFETFKGRIDALYIIGDPLVTANRTRITTLALRAQLPTVYPNREIVAAGGLASYGPTFADLYRRAADYVDKILRGVKPADIPVEQPTKFDLIINLTTAKALGLTVPQTLLTAADEVIE